MQAGKGEITTAGQITKLTFRALYFRQSEYAEIGLCVVIGGRQRSYAIGGKLDLG